MSAPHVVILGAGPAGVGAARQLRMQDRARVTVLEQRDRVGGNSASFELAGGRVDYGSHRLHPACDPVILEDIRGLLGDELVTRPRHGRIRLRGRWIHFPLKPVDLFLRLDRAFALGAGRDAVTGVFRGDATAGETFAEVLEASLGPTICRDFYFPYARKIWGREPEALSAIQARRRVAANSFAKLARKILGQLPGVKPIGFQHFYYPREGFGAISEAYADDAASRGADLRLGHRVVGVERSETGWRVETTSDEGSQSLEADYLWSTLPITVLARLAHPAAPDPVREAAESIRYRSMVLVYLTLGRDRYTEYDAHYFPGANVALTRLSEPKNYAATGVPGGRTNLCAELPCDFEDAVWNAEDEALGRSVADQLMQVGLPDPGPLAGVTVRRLRFAYPIYDIGYEARFETLDAWAAGLPRALTFGRQGLFAHDNTHHALAMAYAAAECLGPQGFDDARWAGYRREFETHVVED